MSQSNLPAVPAGQCAAAADDTITLNVEAHADRVMQLVHRLHARQLDAAELSADMRRECIFHLTEEGLTNIEIGELIHISARTVTRDRAALRALDAIEPNLLLGDQMLGELERLTTSSVQRLTRTARDPQSPPQVRVWAEEAIVRTYQRLIETARRMHYIEDGRHRLAHQRDTDPAEQQRRRERMAAWGQGMGSP